jgi:hypothetical protein
MTFLNMCKKAFLMLGCFIFLFSTNVNSVSAQADIGVLFVFHGGMEVNKPNYMFDAVAHQFSYNPNHSVYKFVIWTPSFWPLMLGGDATDFALRFLRMYEFEYERIGGTDPFHAISMQQMADMKSVLDANPYGLTFEVDWSGYMAADQPDHYAYPRFLYYGPDGLADPEGDYPDCKYCGEGESDGVVLGFDAGTSAFSVGAALTGQTSGATAVIDEVTVNAGSWGVEDAAGFISLSNVSGSFEDDETTVDDGGIPGSATADGTTTWPDCDPERYNVDGPVERLLNQGVSQIIVIDWTMGGPRFSKTFDVVEMSKRALADWNDAHGTSVPLLWVNDYSNLMERSYPLEPEGWTNSLKVPTLDSHVLLNGSPNPVNSDPVIVDLHVEVIEDAFSSAVSDADTGVMIFNHALHDYNEPFDPKINDTLIINKGIKSKLTSLHPDMDPDNIIGAFGGIQTINPDNGLEERNRPMRGESYGHAWLYETDKVMPGDEWGYRYWDALEYLKNRGVKHIVITFPQVVIDNALNMVEIYNQIAGKEIGYKNWLQWGTGDFTRYPGVGHPFADYWGIWVNTDCGEWELNYDSGTVAFSNSATLTGQTSGATGVIKWSSGNVTAGKLTIKELSGTFQDNELIIDDKGGSASANETETMTSKPECCFEMGGCDDPLQPYPPVRQTPLDQKMADLDPSLCFDVSEYGNLGYDPSVGPPDPDKPVQDQYTGTWEMYIPPNDDPRVGQMLANHVLNAAVNPMVYLTNGDVESITEGESVTFEAHVTGGGVPTYTYEWSVREEGDASWSTTGGNSSTWIWNSVSGDEGTYDVRCGVTDSQTRTGEVTWEGFVITDVGDETTTTTTASSEPCPSEEIYGEHSEETELLRHFRDNALSQTPAGQEIIRLYYEWSPAIVKAMEQDEEFKEEMKEMVDGVLGLIGRSEE